MERRMHELDDISHAERDEGATYVPPFNIRAVFAADSLEKTTSADLSPICTLLTWPQNETEKETYQGRLVELDRMC